MGEFEKILRDNLSLGVLNDRLIAKLVDDGVIRGISRLEVEKEGPSSTLDLQLSDEGWELAGTFKPKSEQAHEEIEHLVDKHAIRKLNQLEEGEVLHPEKVYLIKLKQALNLKSNLNLYAQASGKSSIGRLDVLTRLLINNEPVYDVVRSGYQGDLFVEVIPLSFPILVKKGYSLNQIRFFHGEPSQGLLSPETLQAFSGTTPLILDQDGHPKIKDVHKLSIDLSSVKIQGKDTCAFVAKDDPNLDPIDFTKRGHYDPTRYWDPISPVKESITMEKDSFYILRSKERFCLPEDVAVRCIAYTENLGETRIHYAGFAHPWFARRNGGGGRKGAPLIFEVRCHSFPVLARDGEEFARIEFYKMACPTRVTNPDYDPQELKLSKCFRDWQ
jgi:dCTP deaminase